MSSSNSDSQSHSHPQDCSVTGAVLAHFLDGDSQAAVTNADGWVLTWTAGELADHRAECALCDVALARARRLDALMASGVEAQVDPGLAERWLDAAACSGSQNSGSQNSGSQNSGSQNSGSQNSGSQSSGSQNSRSQNSDAGSDSGSRKPGHGQVADESVPLSVEEISAIDWVHLESDLRRATLSGAALLAVAGTLLAVGLTVGFVIDFAGSDEDALTGGVQLAGGGSQALALPPESGEPEKGEPETGEHSATELVDSSAPDSSAPASASHDEGVSVGELQAAVSQAAEEPSRPRSTGSLDFESELLRLPDRVGSARRLQRPAVRILRFPSIHTGPDLVHCQRMLELPLIPGSAAFGLTLGLRRFAYEGLARSEHPGAQTLLIERLATLRSGPELEGLVVRLRGHRQVTAAIRHRLRSFEGDASVMRAAARLGGVRIDADLRAAVRKDELRADDVAVALRDMDRRPGAAELLLALWADLKARDGQQDDIDLADRWFGRRERCVSGEAALVFIEGLSSSRSAPVRRRCILALGAMQAAEASAVLTDVVSGPRHEDAELAAFALGRLRAGADDLVELIESDWRPLRRRTYLMAAAASRKDPVVLRWLRRMRLSGEERRLLIAGGFGVEQIPIVANLFRDRYVSGY